MIKNRSDPPNLKPFREDSRGREKLFIQGSELKSPVNIPQWTVRDIRRLHFGYYHWTIKTQRFEDTKMNLIVYLDS